MDEVEGAGAFISALTVVEQDAAATAAPGPAPLSERVDGYTGRPRQVEVPLTDLARSSDEVPPAIAPSAV